MRSCLDLFCGGGGTAQGVLNAGFDYVVGIDNKPHPNYPGELIIADVLDLPRLIPDYKERFDFICASPPCQAFSVATKASKTQHKHVNLIPQTRELLKGHPYTMIENVPGSPIRKDLILTGPSVGLFKIERRRHFELSFFVMQPPYPKLERWRWEQGLAMTVTKSMCSNSHFYPRKKAGLKGMPSKEECYEAMGMHPDTQMTRSEIGEAVAPPMAEFIAYHALKQMEMDNG